MEEMVEMVVTELVANNPGSVIVAVVVAAAVVERVEILETAE